MVVIRIITYTTGNPGWNCCLLRSWCETGGPAPSLPIPAGGGELSACRVSRRCSAGGKSSAGRWQPHFTKSLLVLRCFFLHHNKCLIFWNMSKKEDFPPCLGSRFKFLFCMKCSRIFNSSLPVSSDSSFMKWESTSASSLEVTTQFSSDPTSFWQKKYIFE